MEEKGGGGALTRGWSFPEECERERPAPFERREKMERLHGLLQGKRSPPFHRGVRRTNGRPQGKGKKSAPTEEKERNRKEGTSAVQIMARRGKGGSPENFAGREPSALKDERGPAIGLSVVGKRRGNLRFAAL